MSARVFHFVQEAKSASFALCGAPINTKRDKVTANWTDKVSGVSCKKCIAKIEKLGLDAVESKPAKPAKRYKDKKVIRSLKKVHKQAGKYFSRVANVGTGTRVAPNAEQSVRIEQAEQLLGIIDAMLTREREGWLAL